MIQNFQKRKEIMLKEKERLKGKKVILIDI